MRNDRLSAQTRALLETLSPGGRAWFELDDARLQVENSRTRLRLSRAGVPNPLRWLHARSQEVVYTDESPDLRDLPEQDEQTIIALGFSPDGRVRHTLGDYDVWTGPDGFVQLETLGERRFLWALFDDRQKIVVAPRDEVSESLAETQREAIYLWASDDFAYDYGRLLEAAAAYAEGSSAKPLYHHDDPGLTLEVTRFYEKHAVSLRWLGRVGAASALGWVMDRVGVSSYVENLDQNFDEIAGSIISGLDLSTTLAADGVRIACPECGATNRLDPVRFGATARCGKCKAAIPTTDRVVTVTCFDAFHAFIDEVSLPLLVYFWERGEGGSVVILPQVALAAKKSNGAFGVLSVDVSIHPLLAARFNVRELPMTLRMVDGLVAQRASQKMTWEALVAFGETGEGGERG